MDELTGVSVDKVSLVGDDVGNFSELMTDPLFDYVGNMTHASYPYRYCWKCADGSFIQWGDENKNVKPIRIEFNPNKVMMDKLRRVLLRVKYAELTRCDLTFDFQIDLSRALFLDMKFRKSNEWRDGTGRLETHYVGCGDPMIIRIYNKAVEQKDDTGRVWWRVEAELHRGFLETYNNGLGLADPFSGLYIKFPDVSSIDDFQTRACVEYLMRNPNELGNLSKNTRSKYKKILATLDGGKVIDMCELFKQYKPRLTKILSDSLEYARKHDVHLYA